MKRFLPLLAFLLFAALPAMGADITDLRLKPGEKGDHVSIHLNRRSEYKVFRVDATPPRIAVDIEGGRMRTRAEIPADYHGTLIKGVRFGFHDQSTGRLVFDLSSDASPHNIRMVSAGENEGYWLEFDLSSRPDATAQEKPKHASKPVIVIDAGHGGQDPGTSGRGGTYEKDLTLRYALALQKSLEKSGRYKVALTRDDDRYLFLKERVKRARAAHGDLFISLHADSAPTRFARGLSVYTISEKSSDKESAALAAQENKADVIGGMDLSGESDDVADILIDLAERETRDKSAQFADLAIKYLGREVGLLSNTHRFAGFAVLKAPDIPSVLVEIGFLTNPKEESQLKSHNYEARVIKGLTQAVDDYFGKRS